MRQAILALGLMAIGLQGAWAQAPGLRVQSQVEGLAFTPLAALPPAPRGADGRLCGFAKPGETPAGRLVSRAGWAVTGEEKLGRLQAVSFAGEFQPGTSGSCEIRQGNVALFEGEQILAVAYARPGARRSIGAILPLEIAGQPGGLRLWDGDFLSQPLADLRAQPDGTLALQPLAPEETRCQGRVTLPNLYGKPITEARRLLQARGWTPVPGERQGSDIGGREEALAQAGVVEVDSCSGTGFGYCRFGYRSGSALLDVTTVGDNPVPSVSDYGVRCGGG
ncbi:PASTA domain-containing protein [Roseomonas sp. USHLN139]|uniref:PASTA domain-containing protein n=1 Tax=Roseomonas sp. USHLN139 TaxID=3081298 RepID=UPI003B011775